MGKLLKIGLFLFGLALYLNIGWVIGTYNYHITYVNPSEIESVTDKFMAGPNLIFNHHTLENQHKKIDQISYSVLWPVMIFFTIICWIFYGLYYGLCFLSWLIFGGGIAKLLGLG